MNGKGNDIADMNSTPIGKLPPPSNLSMRAEAIGGGDASYQEILKNMELHRTMQSQQLSSAPPAPQMQMQQMQQQMQDIQAPMRQMQMGDDDDAINIIPTKPQMAPRQQQQQQQQQQQHRSAKKKSSKKFDLRKLRPALVVATIVFLVLSRGAPMIAMRLPFSVDAITGKFTIAGLLIISMLSGGMYLGINELIKRYISDREDD